jgi:hypothetical protein
MTLALAVSFCIAGLVASAGMLVTDFLIEKLSGPMGLGGGVLVILVGSEPGPSRRCRGIHRVRRLASSGLVAGTNVRVRAVYLLGSIDGTV